MDFVRVYKNSISTANLINSFKMSNIPEQQFVVNSGVVIVQFFASSSSDLGEGWKINYTSELSNNPDYKMTDDFKVFPNPGSLASTIIINSEYSGPAEIIIYNILGEIISLKSFELMPCDNSIPISEINSDMKNGMYFISLKANNRVYSTGFVLMDK